MLDALRTQAVHSAENVRITVMEVLPDWPRINRNAPLNRLEVSSRIELHRSAPGEERHKSTRRQAEALVELIDDAMSSVLVE